MSIDYRILSFLLLPFLLPTLINSTPHPQKGNRDDHRPADKVAVVEQTTTTTTSDDTAVIDQDDSHNNDDDVPIVPSTDSGNSNGNGNGKRGLAYNSSSPSLQVFANSEISWVHSWSSSPFDAPSEFLFVPTLWGDEPPHTDNWASLAEGHPYLMSFNEPDIIGQADMTVGDAVTAYNRLIFPLRKDGVQIGAPSVCSGSGNNDRGVPMGTGWLREFLEQCDDPDSCVADFVSGHWYGCPGGTCSVSDDVSSFKGYVNDLISTADGRDVWVPEFQRYGDEAGQREFLEAVLPWLDDSAVVRYAYYMVVDGILTTGGEVNALGGAYAGI
ncbi:MAG: hypothetical protein Q9205_005932 [Flavoplaca limonia]